MYDPGYFSEFRKYDYNREFESLTRFLVRLSTEEDVRDTLKLAFSLQCIYPMQKYDFEKFIEYYDYETCELE